MPHAFKITSSHPAVATLIALHADLAGQISDNKREGERLVEAMKHVEAVIRLFDPAYDVRRIAVKRRNRVNPWFRRGTMFRAVLDVLKAASEPLTVREIASRVLAAQGVAEPDRAMLRHLEGGIRTSLANKAGKAVEAVGHYPARWRVV